MDPAARAPTLPTRAIRVTAWSDRQLAGGLSVVLFVLAAWPLTLVEVPPYQDLPNHLATASVIAHLKAYPEYVFNGFFKTNAALFAWLYLVGKVTGLKLAARLFTACILVLNALVLPRFVLHFTGSRSKMVVASLLAWPMIHPWFVSMGMLDFALAVPLSLALLILVDGHRKRRRPWERAASAGAIAGLGVVTWYAHVFPLLLLHLLVGIECLLRPTWKERIAAARGYLAPLVPVMVLALVSVGLHLHAAAGPNTGFISFEKMLAPWELVYNLWAEWFWGFTNRSLTSMVPCIVLGVLGVRGVWQQRSAAHEARPAFFSPVALLVFLLLYCFVPYKYTNWFHVNSRFLAFMWVGLLLYVPERLPRWLVVLLGASALLYSVGMGVDYVRLDRDRIEFTAGLEAVPEGSRLLPLVFDYKGASVNTRNLQHMWGYYVTERHTSAPLLFAHSKSFPITYSAPPPLRFSHLLLENFASETATPAKLCALQSRIDGCDENFRDTWASFWTDAVPRFDHVLLWDPTPEAVAMLPPELHRTFERGRLQIYERVQR